MFNEDILLNSLRTRIQELNLECHIKDELLLCFIRARKYNLDRAFISLKNYLKLVGNYPDLLTNLRESGLRPQLSKRLQVVYNGQDQQGKRIFIFRAGRWNPAETTLDDIFRCNVFYLQRLASQPKVQINGIVAIVDLQNLGLYQARHFTPSHAKKIADLLTQAFPLSFQGIHIVNQNWVISLLMSIIWPLLSSKIQKRIHYHGNSWSSLHEYVNAADLPEDYGGEQQRLDLSCGTIDSDVILDDETQPNLFDFKN